MSVSYQDYYETLGVKRTATAQEISKSYRSLARKFHPDVSKEKGAEDKFKAISEAYEVLKDPEKRKLYDQLGANWKAGQDFKPPPGWDDIFAQFGGAFDQQSGGGRGRTQQRGYGRQSGRGEQSATGSTSGATFSFGGGGAGGFSDFFDMLFGATAQGEPMGKRGSAKSAGPGGSRKPRTTAWGFGENEDSGDRRASLAVTPLEAINGGTKIIQLPSYTGGEGKKLKVKIPANTAHGSTIRLTGQGEPGSISKSKRGDLMLEIDVRPGDGYEIQGSNLTTKLKTSAWVAALGEKLDVNTPDGPVSLKIPAGTESGQQLRLRGRGLPIKGSKTRGDLILEISIIVPKNLTEEQRELWEKLAKISS